MREDDNLKLADEFATPGTVMHFLIRQGFLPSNEQVAEKILCDIIKSEEELRWKIEKYKMGFEHWID